MLPRRPLTMLFGFRREASAQRFLSLIPKLPTRQKSIADLNPAEQKRFGPPLTSSGPRNTGRK